MNLSELSRERLSKALATLRNCEALSAEATRRYVARRPEDAPLRSAYQLSNVLWQVTTAVPVIEAALRTLQEPGDAEEIVARIQAALNLDDDDPGRVSSLGCYFPASGRDHKRREGEDVLTWLDVVASESEVLSEAWHRERANALSGEVLTSAEELSGAVDELIAGSETAPHENTGAAGGLQYEWHERPGMICARTEARVGDYTLCARTLSGGEITWYVAHHVDNIVAEPQDGETCASLLDAQFAAEGAYQQHVASAADVSATGHMAGEEVA